VSKELVVIALFLAIIVLLACVSSFFNNYIFYDWIKDMAYFTRPIAAILAGYLVSKKINNFKSILKIIVGVSFIFAVIHILKVVLLVDFRNASVSSIRNAAGISNQIEIIALVILLVSKKYKDLDVTNNRLQKTILLIVFFISFSLYFSRTMIVALVIFLLASYGYLIITKKAIKYGLLILVSFSLFYGYLFSREFERDKPGIESFLYKMKVAPAEIFIPVKSVDTKDHAKLWDRWRAYEASMAITQMNTFSNFAIGKGFGALVDLKFYAPLGSENMRYIPTLHNGYVTILFKTGVFGLLFYLMFLLVLYLYSYKKVNFMQKRVVYNLIGGIAVYYVFTTLIITGIYNVMDIYTFILGILLYFSVDVEKKLKEE
jgi:O-antigen ligase